jgi:hypothetical protein
MGLPLGVLKVPPGADGIGHTKGSSRCSKSTCAISDQGLGSSDRWRMGLGMLLDWLEQADGDTWQARWQPTGADDPQFDWQKAAGADKTWKRHGTMMALQMMMCHRVIRPSHAQLHPQRFQTRPPAFSPSELGPCDFALVPFSRGGNCSQKPLLLVLGVPESLHRVLVRVVDWRNRRGKRRACQPFANPPAEPRSIDSKKIE